MEETKSEVKVNSVSGDGAYDKLKFRESVGKDIEQRIPPQENAVLSKNKGALAQRDAAIKRIEKVGRKECKKEKGYHIRSKSEVNMYRYKKIFGGTMYAREEVCQKTESLIKCKILNKFVDLGMPESYKVAN